MLVVLLTTGIALLVAGAALLLTDLQQNRRASADDLATEASILAIAIAPALSFDDRESATRHLSALQARASISAAALYTPDGALYAFYVRSGETPPPATRPNLGMGAQVEGERVELLQSIIQAGEPLGSIYLRANYDVTGRVTAYAGIVAAVLVLSLFVALITSGWLQRMITDPLESMAGVARKVAEDRDYSARARKVTNDEIGFVVEAFNNMLEEVQSQIQVRLATEHALNEANRRKDEFLATLAHELRNPLAPIRNAVRILELPNADERQRRWGREVIARQVHHMALLLDDLLDVSRITRGQLELKRDYVELASVIEVAVETARPLLETKRHTLTIHSPSEPLQLEADPLRLSQVLANLLTNAAKYTDPGGRIELSASVKGEELRLAVKDNGIGLSPETIPRLFAMFSQVGSAIDRAEGGLGIGLALVKGLVSLHRGTVEARSDGLGRGSEFIVRLPASIVVSARGTGASVPRGPELLRSLGKVLIADDNRDAAETLAAVLRFSGHEVMTAFSGTEALEIAMREHPQALLLDIGMPGLNGYEVARRIRLEAWGRRALLVALTGWGQHDDKQRAMVAGFDEHLTKPVDPAMLGRLLAARLSAMQNAREG
jgi:two-component system, sensor histidine kinase